MHLYWNLGNLQKSGSVVLMLCDKYLLLYMLSNGRRKQPSICRVEAWLIGFLSNTLNNTEATPQCTQPYVIVMKHLPTAEHAS